MKITDAITNFCKDMVAQINTSDFNNEQRVELGIMLKFAEANVLRQIVDEEVDGLLKGLAEEPDRLEGECQKRGNPTYCGRVIVRIRPKPSQP